MAQVVRSWESRVRGKLNHVKSFDAGSSLLSYFHGEKRTCRITTRVRLVSSPSQLRRRDRQGESYLGRAASLQGKGPTPLLGFFYLQLRPLPSTAGSLLSSTLDTLDLLPNLLLSSESCWTGSMGIGEEL
jgi:hypothetical protein